MNTAVAAVLLHTMGWTPADITRGFAALADRMIIPGRLQQVVLTGGPAAYVDYAHTPDAITATLQALRPVTPGTLVAVIGAGGGRDPGKREAMGAAAATAADRVVVTDDNPRFEDPAAIRSAVLAGARAVAGDRVEEIQGRAEAISAALRLAKNAPGGTVAVLGRGHEQGQDVAGSIRPFDDAEALRAAWCELSDHPAGSS